MIPPVSGCNTYFSMGFQVSVLIKAFLIETASIVLITEPISSQICKVTSGIYVLFSTFNLKLKISFHLQLGCLVDFCSYPDIFTNA